MKTLLACLAVFGECMVFGILMGLFRETTGAHAAPAILLIPFFLIVGWTWKSITKKEDAEE